jgi:hypothetical protein
VLEVWDQAWGLAVYFQDGAFFQCPLKVEGDKKEIILFLHMAEEVETKMGARALSLMFF